MVGNVAPVPGGIGVQEAALTGGSHRVRHPGDARARDGASCSAASRSRSRRSSGSSPCAGCGPRGTRRRAGRPRGDRELDRPPGPGCTRSSPVRARWRSDRRCGAREPRRALERSLIRDRRRRRPGTRPRTGLRAGTAALPVGQHAHETARELMELALGIALAVRRRVRLAAATGQAAEAGLAVEGGNRTPGPSQPAVGVRRRRGAGARTEAPRVDRARCRDDLRRRSRRGRGDGAVRHLRRHRHWPRDDAVGLAIVFGTRAEERMTDVSTGSWRTSGR